MYHNPDDDDKDPNHDAKIVLAGMFFFAFGLAVVAIIILLQEYVAGPLGL